MNDCRMGGKVSDFSCYAVIKPRPDRKEDITITDRCIRRVAPMDFQIPDVQVMGCGNCPFSHYGSNNRNPCHFCKLQHFRMCMVACS